MATESGRKPLLWNHPRALAAALQVDALTDLQRRSARLRDRDEHAAPRPHDDLLAGNRLRVVALDFVPDERAADRAGDHGNVATRAGSDQAAEADARRTAQDR